LTKQEADNPLEVVAVISVLPTFKANMTSSSDTVATFSSDDFQIIDLSEAFSDK